MTDPGATRAIILAAGEAKRLGPEAGDRHKCLIDVGGRPIIDYQLAPLLAAGPAAVTVVVGYQAAVLERELTDRYPSAGLRFVENPEYAETNTIWSLALARDVLARGALLFNADLVIDPEVVRRLLAGAAARSRLAVTRAACGDEEVKLTVDEAGRVTRIGKQLDPAVCLGEFIGAARFSPACGARYARELDAVAADHRDEYFEYALDRILAEQDVRMLDVTDLPSIEIDFPEDLARARAEVAPQIRARGTR